MNTFSKVSIKVNMGKELRLKMCHIEDFSKVALVDVKSGQGLYWDSWEGERITKEVGANLEVEVAPGILEKYLDLESFDNKGQ